MAGAPTGNQNAAKGKQFQGALKRALARKSKNENVDGGLNEVADQLVDAALKGEQWAIKEIADRIDGRPAQTIEGNPDKPLIHKVVTELVNATPAGK